MPSSSVYPSCGISPSISVMSFRSVLLSEGSSSPATMEKSSPIRLTALSLAPSMLAITELVTTGIYAETTSSPSSSSSETMLSISAVVSP